MNHYLMVGLGLALAGVGGKLFVKAIVGLAQRLRVPAALVASTVAAFGTSSPELFVAVSAALRGQPRLTFGDVLGSNVVNVALVLALAVVIAPLRAASANLKYNFPAAIAVPLLTGLLLADGLLSRWEGTLMLGLFAAWVGLLIWRGRCPQEARGRQAQGAAMSGGKVAGVGLLGLGLLIGSGQMIVQGATAIAQAFGISSFIIGATVVAVGTSTPEIVTTVVARLQGRADVSLGTILGSNLFNGLLIVPLVAEIHPIAISLGEVALPLLFGLAAIMLAYPGGQGCLTRWRGALLLALYGAYLAAVILRGGGLPAAPASGAVKTTQTQETS